MSALRDSLLEFLDNPKTFISTNIVLPPTSPSNKTVKGTGSGVFQFSWAKSARTGKRGARDCDMYRIENPDNYNTANPRFMAYYCHYSTDEIFHLVLGDKMSLMVTPTMNGCSFGVGSATETGERRVAHANVSRSASTPEGITQQGRTQAEMIGEIIPTATVFGPKDYVDTDVFGTTIGVRNGRHWSFFMQVWKRPTSTSYILDRIKDIA